jgi:toxin ParE1/3/4
LIVVWLPQAIKSRDAQLDYIAQANISAAIEQGDRIEHTTKLFATNPEIGRAGRKQGTREFVIPSTSFILVYRIRSKAERLEILRILHGAEQWPK